jgi:aldehyde dehydrogenase
VLTGGARNELLGDLAGGFYVKPTVFKVNNKMRVFQEEIFKPVVSVTTFKDDDEALSLANDALYGLGAGIWSRDASRLYRFGCRPRNPQDDARSLSADQEPARDLQPEGARLLLN